MKTPNNLAVSLLFLALSSAAWAQLSPEQLQERGETSFREGKIKESVADFDEVVKQAPRYAPYNWQRGIALYYAERYQDGVAQFELHRTVNAEDVENAVWHLLCAVRAPEGTLAKAQANLIPIKDDRRIPMMLVHEMFAGKVTPEKVLEAAKAGGDNGVFFGDLYVGLYYEAAGDAAKSLEYVKKAAENPSSGHYMGDVARVHVKLREKK